MAILRKISDDRFNGNHPNGIHEGYMKIGKLFRAPEVGKYCAVGTLCTSEITEIVSQTEDVIVFKTLNSTYRLTL